MTIQRRNGCDTAFGSWVRGEVRLDSVHKRLSIMDTDFWIHQYRSHKDKCGDRSVDSIMCVEVKAYAKDLPFSQRDTIAIVNAAFRKIFTTRDGKNKIIKVKLGHEIRLIKFYGFFVLKLETDNPITSKWMEWNGMQIGYDDLIDVFNFDRDPRTLRFRSERRHHIPGRLHSVIGLFQG